MMSTEILCAVSVVILSIVAYAVSSLAYAVAEKVSMLKDEYFRFKHAHFESLDLLNWHVEQLSKYERQFHDKFEKKVEWVGCMVMAMEMRSSKHLACLATFSRHLSMSFDEWELRQDEHFFKRQVTHYLHRLCSSRLSRGHRTTPVYCELTMSVVLNALLSWLAVPTAQQNEGVDYGHERSKLRIAMVQGAFGDLPEPIKQEMRLADLGASLELVVRRITTLKAQCVAERIPFEPMGNEPLQWPY